MPIGRGLRGSTHRHLRSSWIDREVFVERLSEREKEEIVRLAATGLPSRLIGQEIGRHHRTVWGHIARLRRPAVPEPVRSALRLSLAEREEISRGLAGGESLRAIARRLGRSPSTISREVAANGGRRRYRACRADKAAVQRIRRPKPSKLAACRSAPSGGRGEARGALVSAADLGLAGGRVRRRPGDARVARDDLRVVVRAVPRRVTQGTRPLSAVRAPTRRPRGHS